MCAETTMATRGEWQTQAGRQAVLSSGSWELGMADKRPKARLSGASWTHFLAAQGQNALQADSRKWREGGQDTGKTPLALRAGSPLKGRRVPPLRPGTAL